MRTLIAEDDPVTRRLLESSLKKWGYQVMTVSDGAAACAALEEPRNDIGIALLDRVMPGIDGLEVCQRTRHRPDSRYVYVILLTGRDREADIVAGLEAGADDYITKPFHAEELRVRIHAGRRVVDLERALLEANEQLQIQAMTDSLTGMLNHGAIVRRLDEEVSRAIRHGEALALAMVDVDRFKEVNDTLGHIVGDKVLAEVSRRIGAAVRSYDVVGRYGGEEFLVIMPCVTVETATTVAERLLAAVSGSPVVSSDGSARVTVSVGVVPANPAAQNICGQDLLRRADEALYRAKAEGRNRVVVLCESCAAAT